MKFFPISRLLIAIGAPVVLVNGAMLYAVIEYENHHQSLEEALRLKHYSYLLADELRQTSESLTKYARLYSVDMDNKYEKIYNNITEIYQGTAPRPRNYNNIYWDFVAADQGLPVGGPPIALGQLIKNSGIDKNAVTMLEYARTLSDTLTAFEREAINAVNGLFKDAQGHYTIRGEPDFKKAQDILFSDEYMNAKEEIMKGIYEFHSAISDISDRAIEDDYKNVDFVRNVTYVVFLMQFLIIAFMLFVLSRRTFNLAQMATKYQEQAEHHAKLREVMQKTGLAIFDANITRNTLTEEYRKVFAQEMHKDGLSYDRAFQDYLESLVHPEDREGLSSRQSRKSIVETFESGIKEINFEYRVRSKNSQDGWLWMRSTHMLWLNSRNNDLHTIVCIKNIDTEKRHQIQLKWQSERDLLTGLYNRNSGEIKIREILEQAKDTSIHSFMILDIDNFKKVNDTLGHAMGDTLLQKIAAIFVRHFRGTDVIARLGGDEFIIFCPDCNRGLLSKRTRSLLSAVVDMVKEFPNIPVTLSVGIAFAPQDGKNFKSLYRSADMALYQAKYQGKNQFCIYDEQDMKATPYHDTVEEI